MNNEIIEKLNEISKQMKALETQVGLLVQIAENELKKHNGEIINELQVLELLGCTANTLACFRSRNGLPYIKGKPCKYEKTKVVEWYNQYKNKNEAN